MLKRYSLMLTMLLLLSIELVAQFVSVESSIPPGISWKQIGNDTVRVIYPDGLGLQAQRVAALTSKMSKNGKYSLGAEFRKIDIFLLNTSVVSNGYVKVPPYHSKFYTQAPRDAFAGSIDWLDLLSIHEYRHALQYGNAVNGVTKWLYYLFGEAFLAGASHLAVPPWFWEGDAVVQETALSHSGRGRMPVFTASLNAISDLKKPFSYEKMLSGSYRDMVPDHYALGYALNSYGRRAYGNDVWVDVYRQATAYKGIVWSFSNALKHKTGHRIAGMYKNMMFKRGGEKRSPSSPSLFKTDFPKKDPGQYEAPVFRNENEIIALKWSFNREAWFVSLDMEGNEKRLFPTGFGMDKFDVSATGMVWNEIVTDIRWADQSYSNLFTYDFQTRKIRRISKNKRYFNPKFSPDGKLILVTETDKMLSEKLLLLDAQSGELDRELPVTGAYSWGHYCWMDAGTIILTAKKASQNALILYQPDQSIFRTILPFQNDLIEYLSVYEGQVYFVTNAGNRTNQVMRLDPISGKLTPSEISSPYSIEMPTVSATGQIAYVTTEFNEKNIEIRQVKNAFDPSRAFAIDEKRTELEESEKDLKLKAIAAAEGGVVLDDIPVRSYKEKKYAAGFGKMKLHTWLLMPDYPEVAMLFQANDPLSTMGVVVRPGYNLNEKTFFTNVDLEYGKYYPKFDLGFRSYDSRSGSFTTGAGDTLSLKWSETSISAGIHVPLQFSYRNYYYAFRPVAGFEHIMTRGFRGLENQNYEALFFEFTAAAIRRRAYRSMGPKYSFDVAFAAQKILNKDDKVNVNTRMNIYLPGFRDTHGSSIQLNYRYQDKENEYVFYNSYYYSGFYDPLIVSDWVSGVKVNYNLPLWYPDIGLGPFVFVKRLRMNVHYGIDQFGDRGFEMLRSQHVFGAGFTFDARYFRLLDFPLGLRFDFSLRDGEIHFKGIQFNFDIL